MPNTTLPNHHASLCHKSYGFSFTIGLWMILLAFPGGARAQTWHGLYTDATSYAPGDTIKVYLSAPSSEVVVRLVRLDADWTEHARSMVLNVNPQSSGVGSFVEYPGLSLSGRSSFTLEGWIHPTILGGDTVVVAGQYGMEEAAAAIIITPQAQLAAYVSDSPPNDSSHLALAPVPTDLNAWIDSWHHLAMSYDGALLKLYVDGKLAAQHAQTGTVANVTTPFRLGARSEAPGDLTGVFDGRLDSWVLWPRVLSEVEIENRWQRGLTEVDPAPDLSQVELYLNFEDPYPGVGDSSDQSHEAVVVNHGHPRVSGVGGQGHAMRLNHDQIVDAGWDLTAEIVIPTNTPSGMYAIQALPGPDYAPTQDSDKIYVRAIAVRPLPGGPGAPIAVVLPTNTWTTYTHWPHGYGPGITSRSRIPGGDPIEGGNNSGYYIMGDDISTCNYHGWHRPSREASPVMTGAGKGYYSVRAPNSMYMVRWLDAMGFPYHVFSDNDFDQGRISAADYRVLMPHSHHEYWTDGMLNTLTRFLDSGGSVVAPAGNIFTWRVVYGPGGLVEERKTGRSPTYGIADIQSGIDGAFTGSLRNAALCNRGPNHHDGPSFKALGVVIHLVRPCSGTPFCFGQWSARNTDHWLWEGSGIQDDDLFGNGRVPGSYAVGHETDSWYEGMPIPGLAEGQEPVILAEGNEFEPDNPGGRVIPTGFPGLPSATCEDIMASVPSSTQGGNSGIHWENTRSGTILYFPHLGGGHVLVIGASATPWALQSDPTLSSLLKRALLKFAFDTGETRNLIFPHVDSTDGWQTEFGVINANESDTLFGTLSLFDNSGTELSQMHLSIPPNGREQLKIDGSKPIGYGILKCSSGSAAGYAKFTDVDLARAAVPAAHAPSSGDIYLSHVASKTDQWWTRLSLLNLSETTKTIVFEFNDGVTADVSFEPGERKSFTIAELFGDMPQDALTSATLRNASGFAGLELFGWKGQLGGIPLNDATAQTIYYPHVARYDVWWTGLVAYNPWDQAMQLTIKPFSDLGEALTTQEVNIAAKNKYIGVAQDLALPGGTAWFQLEAPKEITGFELFGLNTRINMGGYTGVGIATRQGIFPKLEKTGWTGIAFVNVSDIPSQISLEAYDDLGNLIATNTKTVNALAKEVELADDLLGADLSSATYIRFDSGSDIVGFQLNGSDDMSLLDALPALKID